VSFFGAGGVAGCAGVGGRGLVVSGEGLAAWGLAAWGLPASAGFGATLDPVPGGSGGRGPEPGAGGFGGGSGGRTGRAEAELGMDMAVGIDMAAVIGAGGDA